VLVPRRTTDTDLVVREKGNKTDLLVAAPPLPSLVVRPLPDILEEEFPPALSRLFTLLHDRVGSRGARSVLEQLSGR